VAGETEENHEDSNNDRRHDAGIRQGYLLNTSDYCEPSICNVCFMYIHLRQICLAFGIILIFNTIIVYLIFTATLERVIQSLFSYIKLSIQSHTHFKLPPRRPIKIPLLILRILWRCTVKRCVRLSSFQTRLQYFKAFVVLRIINVSYALSVQQQSYLQNWHDNIYKALNNTAVNNLC
jgi:hypothetical protein